ncbi:MAG: hypothetical protein JRG71_03795 [Deltaproteobacteria bacterium]|nr:hypothetical protein [Deltaproteobacteria bacterium]
MMNKIMWLLLLVSLSLSGCKTVMEYHLDECDSAAVIQDSSDNQNHAILKHGSNNTDDLYASYTFDEGSYVICANKQFRGEGYNAAPDNSWYGARYYIEAPDHDDISPLQTGGKMTLSGWFNTLESGGTIVSKTGGGETNEYRIFIEGGTLKIAIWNENGTPVIFALANSVGDGAWHAFAVTVSINSSWFGDSLEVNGYFDGSHLLTQTVSNYEGYCDETVAPLTIGAMRWNLEGDPKDYFDGYIDELFMTDDVASESKLTDVYNCQLLHKGAKAAGIWGNDVECYTRNCFVCGSGILEGNCDDINELAAYGIIGESGFTNGENSTINENTINGVGNTPTPTGLKEEVDLFFPPLNPPTFPTTGDTDYVSPSDTVFEAGHYGTISFENNDKISDITFSGGDYYISELLVNKTTTINLAAGNYFIERVELKNGTEIIIDTDGQVNIYIKDYLGTSPAGNSLSFNKDGVTENLIVYLYENALFEVGNGNNDDLEADFNGIIYSPYETAKIEFGNNNNIRGAILSAGTVNVGNNTDFDYSTEVKNNIIEALGCTPIVAVDHYELHHDGLGLTCAAEKIIVKACTTATTPCPDVDLATEVNTVTLTVTKNAVWAAGTIDFTGTTSIQLFDSVQEEVAIGLEGETVTCFENGTSNDCTLQFYDTGFIFDVPNLTSCETSVEISIKAVRKDDDSQTCVGNENFVNKTTAVNFWSTYLNPGTGGKKVALNSEDVDTASPGTAISIYFGGEASAKLTVNYDDAGKVGLNAQYTGSEDTGDVGVTLAGNDGFVVVPDHFTVVAKKLDETETKILLNNGTATGSPKIAAGDTFSATVEAVCSNGDPTPNFAWPTTLSAIAPYNPDDDVNGTLGSLINGTLSANDFCDFGDPTDTRDGKAEPEDLKYSEVGNFTMAAEALDYIEEGITINGTTDSVVGRFHPHNFNVEANSPKLISGCDDFTWLGQPVDYATDFDGTSLAPIVTITARNKDNDVTENYIGDWWKLEDIVESYTDSITMLTSVSMGHSWAGHSPETIAADAATRGQVKVTFNGPLSWQRPSGGNVTPFKSDLKLEFVVDDVDASYDNPDDHSATFRLPIDFVPSDHEIRHGRLRLVNAHGSELLPLSMPIVTEYFDGTSFVTNNSDGCTSLASDRSEFTFTTADSIPDADNLTAVAAGEGALDWTNPPNLLGHVDVTVDLSALPWLQYDWDGDGGGHNENPLPARATFGIYKGSEHIIYIRETTWR